MPNVTTAPLQPTAVPAGTPAGSPPIDARDRVARYTARLDEHLIGIASIVERVRFLRRERLIWHARYERFCARVDGGEEPHFGESAFDYALTLAEISVRLSRLEPVTVTAQRIREAAR